MLYEPIAAPFQAFIGADAAVQVPSSLANIAAINLNESFDNSPARKAALGDIRVSKDDDDEEDACSNYLRY